MIVGERQRREDEKLRLQAVITERRKDVAEIESEKLEYKVEIDERVERERSREKEISERIAQLMLQSKCTRIRERVAFQG